MMSKKYTIGVDFGTESCRAVLVDISNGEVRASAQQNYADGVITEKLPFSEVALNRDWALQNPEDYVSSFINTVQNVLRQVSDQIHPKDIIGIGIDFTSSTVLPVKKDGTPLCMIPELRDNPHSWAKLWKHHAAQDEANRLNELAKVREEAFLQRYGGKTSSEWMFPKLWQIINEAPEIYEAMDRFIEATDWIVWQLTGREVRSSCPAGYKALWHKRYGYPDRDFLNMLDPRLVHAIDHKLGKTFLPVGSKAGGLTKYFAEKTGLCEGTAVAVGNVDAHVSAPACGVVEPGTLLLIMGTSICDIVLSDVETYIPGICGVVEDGVIPGYYGYEAGQPAVGDSYAWFVERAVPADYWREAERKGISLYRLLEEKAARLKPGEHGLIALDWLNGNRSTLDDADLTGLILGITLHTKPEDIFRSLIEATAFGQKYIVDNFTSHGVKIDKVIACGGLTYKNRMLMQIFADVLNVEINVSEHEQTSAVGSAMFGAVAAGVSSGGYNDIVEASQNMARIKKEKVIPNQQNVERYNELYREYVKLYHYFGKESEIMKVLKRLQKVNG